MDLDNFKPINDIHGHEVGDLLLIEVADRLNACVRKADSVARLGGDESVVILGELGKTRDEAETNAQNVAEKIRGIIAAPYCLQSNNAPGVCIEHHCTASMGVALFKGQGVIASDILKIADKAMYAAKESGRNRICTHWSELG